ncbi:hypothetical protein GCM10010123_39660 [Pilimelia anulata]|uniref:N-acetyltransferase domain-containing protein n=1 Tax=Pilimelia anulata TaxID=53371 RepID=A0A8J3FCG7_9ACTN|nr:GNAT family N-acetyltransferase [Pilimelia anulata]GGK05775.1 hypothetical protein GCM10010123_39660 [Pilimelia anulata]
MEPPEIAADGLVLRPWRPADAPALTAACQDPMIPRFTTVPSPYLREHADSFILDVAPAALAAGTGVHLGVFAADSGALLGSCGLVRLDRAAGAAEVGYWTAAPARGAGVAERAARALLGWAFATLGLRRVDWRADVGNHASKLVAARLGFRFEGVGRAAPPEVDKWTATLLAGELTDGGPDRPAAPGSAAAARAALFGAPQPTLAARTAGGEPFTLRPPRPADRADWIATYADPDSREWLFDTGREPAERADDSLRAAAAGWAAGDQVIMVAADPADRFLGHMKLLALVPVWPGDWGCGYAVAPHARGRGLATAMLRAASDWGFAALRLDRIEWHAYVGNEASRRAALRAGFVEEGVSRFLDRGARRDCWRAARLATDRWEPAAERDPGPAAGREPARAEPA